MADGSVIIKVDADEKAAVKKLHKVEDEIDKLQAKLNEKQAGRSAILQDIDELQKKLSPLRQELKKAKEEWLSGGERSAVAGTRHSELQAQIAPLQAQLESLYQQVDKYDKEIEGITPKLEEQKRIYGETQIQVAQLTKENTLLQKVSKKVSDSADRFYNRIKGLAKRVFIFTVITAAFRQLRDHMSLAIRTNDEAAASFAQLKAATLTLAQPLVDVLLPALTWVAQALTKVVTVLAYLFSAITGKSFETSKKSAEALEKEKQAIKGVGSAAKEATKSLASFDEINTLAGETASGISEYIMPDFGSLGLDDLPEWIKNLTLDLEAKIRDISFSWDKKTIGKNKDAWIVALTAILGAVLGSMFGGLTGTVIGLLLGASIGLISCTFLDKTKNPELAKDILIVVLSSILGAVLGSMFGGIAGGVIGMLLGATISIISLEFSKGRNSDWDSRDTGIVVLGAILGAVFGAMFGGLTGSVIGLLLGALISFVAIKFQEGNYNKEKAISILRLVLLSILGAIIGSMFGGFVGGVIGLLVGLTFGFTTIAFDEKMSAGAQNAAKNALKIAVTTIVGALIGAVFGGGVFGGIVGGAIGLTLGLAVTLGKASITNNSGISGKSRSETINPRTSAIPALATGTVVPPNREFLAMLGDNKTETEVVSPLSTMKQAMLEALQESGGGGGDVILHVYINGRKMAVEMVKEINDMTREAGKPVLLL